MNLIVSEQPVGRVQFAKPALGPGFAVVYAKSDGTVVNLGRRLDFGEALSGMFRTAFEVDVRRQKTDLTTRDSDLPTRDDRFSFVATVTVGWQVTAPETVVRENVRDGGAAIGRRVLSLMRGISRRYEITECEQVEREINDLHRSGPIAVPELGLSIDHVSAFVTLDDAARDYLQRQVGIERRKDLDGREQDLENQRLNGVMAAVQGEMGLIALHLRHHPQDGLQVLQLMHARQQELAQRQQERFASSEAIFTKMLDEGLVQAADVEEIRKQVLANTLSVISGTTGTQPPMLTAQATVQTAAPASLPPPGPAAQGSAAQGPAGPAAPVSPAAPATRPAPRRRPPGNTQTADPGQTATPPVDPNGVGGWRPRRSPQSGTSTS
ncbi:hypothetical protein QLQ12_39170 [Actinoplanes sp. NEAU-A12]|uniref:Band 7 domain-containing protein n=1 Tax=Actinoplanes sandaracinus TaxID=3045177 RepID=A0ABT6WYE7_9ACTN|nr:hypothetical protein [Actinoplanes sandaracinus]MDI6104630.1 hypothetical protein [Actinoplanes sandaracinus]